MKYSSFSYLVKQGWKSMLANRLMTIASFGVLTCCIVITGVAALVTLNVNSFMNYMGSQNQIEVYLKDEITPEQRNSAEATISAIEGITYQFVSKEQAVLDMQADLEEYAAFLNDFTGENNPGNPLPASFRVAVDNPANVPVVAEKLAIIEGVEEISTPYDLAKVLDGLKKIVSLCGWTLVLVLGIVSVVVISNTIRLTVFARRKEINIMKFVGATNAFIRLPFFVEGVTVGAVSGALATGIICSSYAGLVHYINSLEITLFAWLVDCIIPLGELWPFLLLGFVVFGVVIGSIGTTTSIRKHLKV